MTETDVPKSIFITGGARGLGLGIASAASKANYRVGIFDLKDARSAAGTIDATGYQGSVDDAGALEDALDAFGTPDVLVNNAGIVRFGPLADLSIEDFRAVVDINLTGTFLASQTVARRMAEAGGGSIINITSINGVAAGPNSGAYGATKAAVALLTEQMAIEWADKGIRVNAVAPGLIDGGMSEPIYADPKFRRLREERVPAGRLGTVADVAAAVLFLAGDSASYITGQNLLVDGGVTMSIIANLPRPQSVDGVGDTDQ